MLFLGYTLGKRIRYFRKRTGMTQKELAEAVGVSEPAIRNYELDNRTPDMDTLAGIAGALKVSYYALDMPDLRVVTQALHILFEMEDLFQLKPIMLSNDEVVLRLDLGRLKELYGADPNRQEPPDLDEEEMSELTELIQNKIQSPEAALQMDSMIYNWFIASAHHEEGVIDDETYQDWKMRFPAFSGVTEEGQLALYDQNQMLVPVDSSVIPDADSNRDYFANMEITPIVRKEELIPVEAEKSK